jgi:hypothetical protein
MKYTIQTYNNHFISEQSSVFFLFKISTFQMKSKPGIYKKDKFTWRHVFIFWKPKEKQKNYTLRQVLKFCNDYVLLKRQTFELSIVLIN